MATPVRSIDRSAVALFRANVMLVVVMVMLVIMMMVTALYRATRCTHINRLISSPF